MKGTADERGQKNNQRDSMVENPELLKKKRTSVQEDPIALNRSKTKQTEVLRCLMSAQSKSEAEVGMARK